MPMAMRYPQRRASPKLPGLITLFFSLLLLAVASGDGAALASCQEDGSCLQDEDDGDGPYPTEDESKELLRQIDFALRAGVRPVTVVANVPRKGRGLMYAGGEHLPPGTTVGLYRALLVRRDVWEGWLKDGTVAPGAWEGFWRSYTVEFTGEEGAEEADEEEAKGGGESEERTWMAVPAGDVEGDLDGPTWWTHGPIPDADLQKAIEAINAKVLVDWRRLAGGGDDGGFLLFNAHLINEPSPGVNGGEDEVENVSHLTGSGCRALEGGNEARWCGAAFEAKTSRMVHPGEQLLWCYGDEYRRDYSVAETCLDVSGGSIPR